MFSSDIVHVLLSVYSHNKSTNKIYFTQLCTSFIFTLFYLAPQQDQVGDSIQVVYVRVATVKAFIVAFEVKIVIVQTKTKPWDPKISVRTNI